MSNMKTSFAVGANVMLFVCLALPRTSLAGETYNFDCDVPPAKFSDWSRAIVAKTARISGKIELVEPRHDERWWPVANVFLQSAEPLRGGGLQVILNPDSPDEVQLAIQGKDPKWRPIVFATSKWRGVQLAFAITLNAAGALTVSALDHSETLQLDGFEYEQFTLSCSTGEFKFVDVSIEIE